MSHEPRENGTESDATAQEAPEVIRELQAAREAKWAEAVHATYCHRDDCGGPDPEVDLDEARPFMALAAEETFEATSGLRQELTQAKAENEWLRSEVDDHINLYVDETTRADAAEYALHQARAQVEAAEAREASLQKAIEALADEWDARVPRVRALGKPMHRREANTWDVAVYELRCAALAAEPTPAAEPHAEDGA